MGSILTEYNEKETMEAFYRDGKEEGKAEGKAEGEAEEKLKTASKLKAKNMPIEEIAEITELSVADIEKL